MAAGHVDSSITVCLCAYVYLCTHIYSHICISIYDDDALESDSSGILRCIAGENDALRVKNIYIHVFIP